MNNKVFLKNFQILRKTDFFKRMNVSKCFSNKENTNTKLQKHKNEQNKPIGRIPQKQLNLLKTMNYGSLVLGLGGIAGFTFSILGTDLWTLATLCSINSFLIYQYTKNIVIYMDYRSDDIFIIHKLNLINSTKAFFLPSNYLKQVKEGPFRGKMVLKHSRQNKLFNLDYLDMLDLQIINSKISAKYKNHKNNLFKGKASKDLGHLKSVMIYTLLISFVILIANSFFSKRDKNLEFIDTSNNKTDEDLE